MVTQEFKPRKYEQSDLEQVGELLITHHNATTIPTRKSIFDWIARFNPAADGQTCYLIIENDNKIIAFDGRMPVDMIINNKKERGYFFHDTLVHPEYRKKGLGLALVNSLKTMWEEETDTLAVGMWMNEFTHLCLKRRRYHQLEANYYIRPLNPETILRRFINQKFITRVLSRLSLATLSVYEFIFSKRHYSDISISQIDRFDQRFDDFADKISRKFPLIVLRHSKYLNWKYIDKPSANYSIFTAEKKGELTGYVVLLLNNTGIEDMKLGIIVDILADPEDSQTIASLCQVAIDFFKKEGVDVIQCVLTNKTFIRIFKKFFFFKRRRPVLPVMIANLNKHPSQEIITDIDNWFLTLGDSDAVVWE